MIIVTRLHGTSVAVNCDLIERVEASPETVVLLAGRLDERSPASQRLHLVPSPDPRPRSLLWICGQVRDGQSMVVGDQGALGRGADLPVEPDHSVEASKR
jgi:hypothetical protein